MNRGSQKRTGCGIKVSGLGPGVRGCSDIEARDSASGEGLHSQIRYIPIGPITLGFRV